MLTSISPSSFWMYLETKGEKKQRNHKHFFFSFFLAALGLRCCAQAFSSSGEQGLLFIAVPRLLIAVAFLVAELRL